ncbi:hypothetical protein SAMN04488134_11186 [Amphibacillus marinus]|uniref:YtpI-like protein n=1 Tax=Amphibacillus marinus TaxID=872970 RepID=A0A1H8RYD2_9BACI|nr:hypothetical protein [Amphibacillus marinus]SEO71385.1 hypothetical protein SAMN04488134_11186 [Amphibacillus marinus]
MDTFYLFTPIFILILVLIAFNLIVLLNKGTKQKAQKIFLFQSVILTIIAGLLLFNSGIVIDELGSNGNWMDTFLFIGCGALVVWQVYLFYRKF